MVPQLIPRIRGDPLYLTADESLLDMAKAREELTTHDAYLGNLVDAEGTIAGIVATLDQDPELIRVAHVRSAVGYRLLDATIDPDERADLVALLERERIVFRPAPEAPWRWEWATIPGVAARYKQLEDARKAKRIEVVHAAKAIVDAEKAAGHDVHASGIPVIVIDMVDAIDQDFRTFGVVALVFLVVFLGAVFRRARWVALPLLTTLATATWVVAMLVLEGRRTTVVTANIPSLLVVIGMAHSIHFIIRYREQLALHPDQEETARIGATLRSILVPCLFTALTTAVGFGSLIIAGIRPVVDFGVHMAAGAGIALLLSFTLMPSILVLLPALGQRDGKLEGSADALTRLADWLGRNPYLVIGAAALLSVVSVVGIAQIEVETRFIDYFDEDSAIYRDLKFVDDNMGGTTGIEVVIDGPGPGYFKTAEGLEIADAVHAEMEGRDEIGTVLSVIDMVRVVQGFLNRFGMPAHHEAAIFWVGMLDQATLRAYVTADFRSVRISGRVREGAEVLDRTDLKRHMTGFCWRVTRGTEARARLTGMFVPYTNLLDSLSGSQLKTTLFVALLLFLTFSVLFKSPRAGAVAMIPNAIPILFVLGAMGGTGVHLDMATVMIASVAFGIAVDGTIHYVFRYREELRRGADPREAVRQTHASIGTAILYTSLTAAVGFCVLALSNFKPNVAFGLFTAFAMAAALFADLTVLPSLILVTDLFASERRAPAPDR